MVWDVVAGRALRDECSQHAWELRDFDADSGDNMDTIFLGSKTTEAMNGGCIQCKYIHVCDIYLDKL